MIGKNIDQLSKERTLKLDADYRKYDMILCLEELLHQVQSDPTNKHNGFVGHVWYAYFFC